MKKILSLAAALALCSCSAQPKAADSGSPDIVCTSFALYDWTRNIWGGDDGQITYLLSSGTDMHSYQPTADDIIRVTTCDLLVYAGGESDKWIDDALANGHTCEVVRLMDRTDLVLEEEEKEGMEHDHDHDDHDDEEEFDEHIWLSPDRAVTYCDTIASALAKTFPDHDISANADAYKTRLGELADRYDSLSEGTIIVADRFPFLYLTRDCGLDYYAAFSGCSAESEASFETVTFLTDKANELGVPALFIIDGSDGKLAQTVANGCANSPEILTLDSMQSVTKAAAEGGADYINIMDENLTQLQKGITNA
ncbi:MAG: zinc ABC transporter substrate-binding protein [Oscillospiraceae bacterium]|nr:zinc ABC transporter substrate-binding protein [Oscillospiraceae bacterium]MBQ8978543.1 zinc ABC transporter substrate-binding protein [Oscillospiraceae bacterium]